MADVCAHTPTAAAELAIPELESLYGEHQQRQRALSNAVNHALAASHQQLQRLKERMQRLPLERQLRDEQKAIAQKRQQLIQCTSRRLSQAKQHCEFLRQQLATLDPENVLKRGYAVVRTKNGMIARSAANLGVGQELEIQLGEGQIKVKVTKMVD